MDKDRKICIDLRILKIRRKPLEWSVVKTNGNIPGGKISATLNYYEKLNVIFLFGGKSDPESFSCNLYILDLETLFWTKVMVFDRSQFERAEHSSCIYESKLIILVGINNEIYLVLNFI